MTGLAMQIHNVGLGWLVYDRTGSALALGLVGLAAFLPALLLALVAGAVADRYDRRLIVTACWGLIALADLRTRPRRPAAGCAGLADLRLHRDRRHGALLRQPHQPGAAARNLVPRPFFTTVVTFNATAWQSSSIVGPAVGGLLYALGPADRCSASTATAFATAALLIAWISVRGHGGSVRERPTLESLFAGVTFIRSRPVILGAIRSISSPCCWAGDRPSADLRRQGHPADRSARARRAAQHAGERRHPDDAGARLVPAAPARGADDVHGGDHLRRGDHHRLRPVDARRDLRPPPSSSAARWT